MTLKVISVMRIFKNLTFHSDTGWPGRQPKVSVDSGAYDNIQGTSTHFVSKFVIFKNGKEIDVMYFSVVLISKECIFKEILSTRSLVIKIILI